MNILTKSALLEALHIRDLTHPEEGEHAIQHLLQEVQHALKAIWGCKLHVYRHSPIVSTADNYNRLRYPADGPARSAKYTRYVCDQALLRTSTTAMVPLGLKAIEKQLQGEDLLVCPGLVYRRDSIDRLHLGAIHQVDLWRITAKKLGTPDLREMIQRVVETLLPGKTYRVEERVHPYTLHGLQIDVRYQEEWIEVGECGLAHPDILQENLKDGVAYTGLAMGLGLDRILMLRKGMKDVRLVASPHPKIAGQMLNLDPYQEVSLMPAIQRDLSLVVAEAMDVETLGDQVREALGTEASLIERVEILSEHAYEDLPEKVHQKLGMAPGQKNTLLRIVLQALDRSLTDVEANQYRNRIYAALHQGTKWEWANGGESRNSV
ncbi:MAG: hypothetical protein AAF694_30810 [Bacteroidota bacterium]